jgi:carbamate kinase
VRIVAAVGGNALLERGDPPDAEIQQRHIRAAVAALAPLARSNQLVVTHEIAAVITQTLVSASDPAFTDPAKFVGSVYPEAEARRIAPAGSMGPKVEAVCRFVELTGGTAAIGALRDADAILAGKAGTIVTPSGAYP